MFDDSIQWSYVWSFHPKYQPKSEYSGDSFTNLYQEHHKPLRQAERHIRGIWDEPFQFEVLTGDGKTKRMSSGPCMLYLDYMMEYDWIWFNMVVMWLNMIEWRFLLLKRVWAWNSSKEGSIEIIRGAPPVFGRGVPTELCLCSHSQSHHLYKLGIPSEKHCNPRPRNENAMRGQAEKLWWTRCSKFA